ncbi:hypothetical protein, partial [[Flexibacter] sp. ATCC 35208]|uniref:hypothetical protein n=1 Tax=[Flexibacter] sp. ATCC 35208 TaxID=1936242 RepID=UPI001C6FCD0A
SINNFNTFPSSIHLTVVMKTIVNDYSDSPKGQHPLLHPQEKLFYYEPNCKRLRSIATFFILNDANVCRQPLIGDSIL